MTAPKITGDKEVDRALAALDVKIQKKVLRTALRNAAKSLVAPMKDLVPVETGQTKRSVKVKSGKRSRTAINMEVGVRDEDGESYLGFMEYGTVNQEGSRPVTKTYESKKDPTLAKLIAEIPPAIEKVIKK